MSAGHARRGAADAHVRVCARARGPRAQEDYCTACVRVAANGPRQADVYCGDVRQRRAHERIRAGEPRLDLALSGNTPARGVIANTANSDAIVTNSAWSANG
jgi:hypothetical protein